MLGKILAHIDRMLYRRNFLVGRERFAADSIVNANPVLVTDQTAPRVICGILCGYVAGLCVDDHISCLILKTQVSPGGIEPAAANCLLWQVVVGLRH